MGRTATNTASLTLGKRRKFGGTKLILMLVLAIRGFAPLALASQTNTAEMMNFSCVITAPDDPAYRLATYCEITADKSPSYHPCPILKQACLSMPCLHLVQLARFSKTCYKPNPQQPPCIQHQLKCIKPPIRIPPQTFLHTYQKAIIGIVTSFLSVLAAYTGYANFRLKSCLPRRQADDGQEGWCFGLMTLCTQANLSGSSRLNEDEEDMLHDSDGGDNRQDGCCTPTAPSIMVEESATPTAAADHHYHHHLHHPPGDAN